MQCPSVWSPGEIQHVYMKWDYNETCNVHQCDQHWQGKSNMFIWNRIIMRHVMSISVINIDHRQTIRYHTETGFVYPCTFNWFCVHFKQPNLGNIQFWGQSDTHTHRQTYICTSRAASSQLKRIQVNWTSGAGAMAMQKW